MVKEFLKSEKFIRISRIFLAVAFLNVILYWGFRSIFDELYFSLDLNFLPLGFAIRVNQIYIIFSLAVLLLCLPAFYYSKLKIELGVIIGIFLLPIFCLMSFAYMTSFSITDQIEFIHHKYFYLSDSSHGNGVILYRCDLFGRNCQNLYARNSGIPIHIDFDVNEEKRQLNIFINASIQFIDNDQLVKLSEISDGGYWPDSLSVKIDEESNQSYLSKCYRYRSGQNCELWSLEMSNPAIDLETGYFDYGHDASSAEKEIEIENYFYVGDELIFYVTEEPVCVIEGCAFVEE